MLLLPRKVPDERAPGTVEATIELSPTVTPDGPHVAKAYLYPDAPHLQGPANLNSGRFAWSSVSGLSPAQVHKCVNMVLQAAVLGLHNHQHMHYTQGAQRWEGIDSNKKAWRGEFPEYADCSAFATWCLWNGLDHFHHPDTVNGQRWHAGYTGTLLQHGRSVRSPIPGDLIIYGTGWPGEHTAVYTGGGLVVSHGHEGCPELVRWDQMGIPVMSIRRYI